MPDWPGRTLSNVRIERLLGRGSMAEVYLGQHLPLDRPVAVKILHSHLSVDPAVLARFRAEAQAVAGLRHPNIVQVYDFGAVGGHPYIVMELLPGLSLAGYLQASGPSPPETAARLIVSLAAALDYAHGRGLVHCDVRPANVTLRGEGGALPPAGLPLPLDVEPVLTDFGLARFAGAAALASGVLAGAAAYLSPEQARGETADARADVYALGVMLYELLTGKLPFDADNQFAVVARHLTEAPSGSGSWGRALQAVLERALARDRQARYQRAGDLAADLLLAIFRREGVQEARPSAPSGGLLDTLRLLCEQVRAYERALPAGNYPARAAVASLGRLARQALTEAGDLAASLQPRPPAPHPFSPRELEVLTLAAEGLTNKEIAYRLGLSERTVQFHVNSVFNKTGANSRTEAVALALRQGWLRK